MRVLSLFSGAGGMDLGLERAGHEVVGLCEILEKPRAVLRNRYPGVPLHDDVSTLDGRKFRGRVDIVSGGSPCQDLSVAGRHRGLAGERSGLFWHQCRIAQESDAKWVIWENVPGALTSNRGADFAAVLWGLTGNRPTVPENGWRSTGVCVGAERTAVWRVLDAQYFGVPQRRRRVFVVAGPRDECGLEILVEREVGAWDSAPSRTTESTAAASAGPSVEGDGRRRRILDGPNPGVVTTLRSGSENDAESCKQGAVAPTLNSFDLGDSRTTVAVVGFNWQNGGGYKDSHDGLAITDEGVGPLSRSQVPAVAIDQVRRLTPRECERLMSWPDDWTRWEDTGAEITNGHRYKMCGNGVVSNVTEWIGARIPRG